MSFEDAKAYNKYWSDLENGTHADYPGMSDADAAAWNLADSKLNEHISVDKVDTDAVVTLRAEEGTAQDAFLNGSADDVSGVEGGSGAMSEKQRIADEAAKAYNSKYDPVQRAIKKGYEGVKQTANGGVSFQETEYIYKIDGEEAIATIEATGKRTSDFDAANAKLNLDSTPDGYVWHHLDNYNVDDNTLTMELVKRLAHKASIPHLGSCAQYDAVHGSSYNE